MKILLVTDLYPLFDNQKGVPKTIEAFACAWKDLGHSVSVLKTDFAINTLIRGRKLYKNGLYQNKDIKIFNKNLIFPCCKNPYECAFDIIISHMPAGNIAAGFLAKELNLPHILCVHSSDLKVLKSFKYKPFGLLLKKAINNANTIAARSKWIEKQIKNYSNKPVFCAPSGIESKYLIKEEEIEKKFSGKNMQITCTSQLIKRKNIDKLILAVKDFAHIKLKIMGEGPMDKKLKKLAKNASNIEFLGQKSKEDVFEVLKESQIFILPSDHETFGMSYLEALSCGCITVCSCDCALSGYIKDSKNGFLCRTDTESLKSVIEKILNLEKNEMIKISKNALKTALELEYYTCAKNYIENAKKFC